MTPAPGPSDPGIIIDRRRGWTVTVMLFLFFTINFADKAILGLAAIPLMRDLDLTPEQFGMLGSAFYLLFSLSSAAIGLVSTRVSTKWIIAVMGLIWALCQFPIAIFGSFAVLLACRVILGAGEGPAHPMMMHQIASWFEDEKRALPTSLAALGGAVGIGVAAPTLTWIIVTHGWRWAFVALGVVGLVWTIAWVFVGRDGPLSSTPPATSQETEAVTPAAAVPYKELFGNRTMIGYLMAGFLAYSCVAASVIWIPAFLVNGVGFTQIEAGWVLVVPAAVQIFLTPSIAAWSQRLTARGWSSRVARAGVSGGCLILSGVLMASLPFLPKTVIAPMLGLSLALVSLIFVIGPVMVAEMVPAEKRGAMLGMTNGVHTLAGIVAPVIMGLAIGSIADPVEGYRLAIILLGSWIAAGGLIAVTMMDPGREARRLKERLAD